MTKKESNRKIFIYNLGCPKNHKDTEYIYSDFIEGGFLYTEDIKEASLILINTCGFIDEAKEESIQYIINAVNIKKETGADIFVLGCLAELYAKDLKVSIPEVDYWLGAKDFSKAFSLYQKSKKGNSVSNKQADIFYKPNKVANLYPSKFYSNNLEPYSAFVKISEGCSSKCSFCVIPKIRGRIKYREKREIFDEIEAFVKLGVIEISLIAQDLTYNKQFLKEILRGIEKLSNKPKWLRLMYCNPWGVDEELVKMIKNTECIVDYIDFPIQHISNNVLKNMNRESREKDILYYLDLLRKNDISIRSSIMLGFPGEKETDYLKLKNLVEKGYFHWLGIFVFSEQENTGAYNLSEKVDKRLSIERRNELDALQFEISSKYNRSFIGKDLDVLEVGEEENSFVGRTYFQASQIDGLSFLKNKLNKLAKCRVMDTNGLDIFCQII